MLLQIVLLTSFFHFFISYFLSTLSVDHSFVRLFISLKTLPSLEPKVSSLPSSFTSNFFLEFPLSVLDFEMGYSFLLDALTSLAISRQKFDILSDVEVAHCHESEIALHKGQGIAFFPLMAVLKGGVRFSVDPLVISTLRYYRLCPDQLLPDFYRVVSCVSRLNHTFGLQLDHYDINHMYSLCENKSSNYYLKTKDNRVRLISCLPDSNRNSAGEFVWVCGNWCAREIPCPLSRCEVGLYRSQT